MPLIVMDRKPVTCIRETVVMHPNKRWPDNHTIRYSNRKLLLNI